MSGGSFEYLYIKGINEIFDRYRYSLEHMSDALTEVGYASDAARETHELLLLMRALDVRGELIASRLRDVWHAMEYWRSGDYGEDQFKQTLEKYRGR